jgi:iron-regulated transporter 1
MATPNITTRLYTSHALAAWSSRTFEFGAILFLASIYPGTLLYASLYALIRSLSSTLLSSRIGAYLDRTDRLVSIRLGIMAQRVSVVLSCVLLWVLLRWGNVGVLGWTSFVLLSALACVEKVASLGCTVAVERDWVVVVCEDSEGIDRGALNAGMRRIDLFCKLVAPVFVSFVEAWLGTVWAVGVVLGMSAVSVGVEYIAIARVYDAVPALSTKSTTTEDSMATQPTPDTRPHSRLKALLDPWLTYTASPAFLPSLALSLLYLTVLSTGVHWQTYLLTTAYTPLTVSLLRVLAVISELGATCIAPLLTDRIGPIRGGLWSVNWQVLTLAPAVGLFFYLHERDDGEASSLGAAVLTTGIVASRLGLWSFDLSVQHIVQSTTPPSSRSLFSSCEVALQSFFELLSFAATIVFARPEEFVWPVCVSFGAVVTAAGVFAGFVRRERGHLVHVGRCFGEKRGGYEVVDQVELEALEAGVEERGEGRGET